VAAVLAFVVAFAAGAWLQARHPRAATIRSRTWGANMAVVIPAAIVYAACTIRVDGALAAAFACGVVAWWITVLVALGYGRLAAPRDARVRGALAMSAAFPNTSFLGFPLAQLAFGAEGLRIAVVYDALGPVIPAVVLSTAIARVHSGDAAGRRETVALALRALVSAPTAAIAVGAVLRIVVIGDDPLDLHVVGQLIGPVVGTIGFFVAGLSIPLTSIVHGIGEVVQVLGALVVRLVVAPLLLLGVGAAAGVDVPPALLLSCALPTAVHALVIAREHELATHVVRLAILVSTVLALVVVPIAAA
jgi:predicted permease